MPAVCRYAPWTQQPQQAAGINRRHPLAYGLTGLINGGPGLKGDLIANVRAWQVAGSGIAVPSGYSIGQTSTGTNGVSWDRLSNAATAGPATWRFTSEVFTVVAVVHAFGFSSAEPILHAGYGTGLGWYIASRFSDGTLQAIIQDPSTRLATSASGALKLNALNVIVMRCDAATLELLNNGVSLATGAVGGGSITYEASFTQTGLGGSPNPFSRTAAAMAYHYGAVWNRRLSDAEVRHLAANPWQFFEPMTRAVYFAAPPSAIPTLSAATAIDITATTARPRVTLTY